MAQYKRKPNPDTGISFVPKTTPEFLAEIEETLVEAGLGTKRKVKVSIEARTRIESLVLRRVSVSAIRRYCREQYGIGATTVDRHIQRFYEELSREEAAARPHRRAVQLRRLAAELEAAAKDKKHMAVCSFERLIAEIEGNREPERVQVISTNIHGSLQDVLQAYSDEQVHELAREQQMLEAKAELAERAGLAPQLTLGSQPPGRA